MGKIALLLSKVKDIMKIIYLLRDGFFYLLDFFKIKKRNREINKKVKEFKNAKTKDDIRDTFNNLP